MDGSGGGIYANGDYHNIEKTNVIINSTIITGNKVGGTGSGGGCYIYNSNAILP